MKQLTNNLNGLRGVMLFMISLYCGVASGTDYYCDFSVNGIYYQFISGTTDEVAVSYNNYETGKYGGNYTNYSGYVSVPASVTHGEKTYKVTAVSDHAFQDCSVTSVNLPSTIKSIGYAAFLDCYQLTTVNLPSAITKIGDNAFNGCTALTNVTLPSALKEIGYNSFASCKTFTSINIPDGVTSIGDNAFSGCINLSSISVPNSVVNVGTSVFYGTAWYTNQPDGLIYVGRIAYWYKGTMPENTTIDIKDGTVSIASSLFKGYTNLVSINIPNSVSSIGNQAFYGCTGLISIDIPSGVTSIGGSTFYNCYALSSVNIPNTVTRIDNYAFYNCIGLSSVTIPYGVTSIGYYAFYNCSSLTEVTIPISVTSIEETAFSGTAWYNNQPDGLMYAGKVAYKYIGTMPENTSITLQEGTLGIADHAFYSCKGLASIEIPNSVTSIASSAFYGCSGLKSVTIPNSVTSIGSSAFYGCSGLTEVTIPNSVNTIGDGTFSGCSGLTSVTIPNSVTSIGGYAFQNCSCLTEVKIPNSVTSIGSYAFFGCSGLTSVTIPNSVTLIGDQAFNGCSSLTDINNYRVTPQDIWVSTFSNYSATLHVGKGYKSSYGATNYWKNFTIVEDIDIEISGSCGDNANYSLDTKTGLLSITGTGDMTNYRTEGSVPWYPQREFIKELEISDGITSIGNYALYGCTKLPSMSIPNSVTAIGDKTFYFCSGLTSISIPNSIKSIGSYAFGKCSALVDVYCHTRKGPAMGNDVFIESDIQFAMLYVPETSINGYKATSPWSGFGNIVALEDEPGVEKCATPVISIVDGQLSFSCETEGVNYICRAEFITDGNNVKQPRQLQIFVTAIKDGYVPSDEATEEIELSTISGIKGDVNEDGTINGTDIQEVINIIVNGE